MHSPSSSSSSRPVAWLVQVLLLCVLGLSSSTRGVFGDDAWSYTATFSLSGSEGTLEGAPTITSNPTPNYAQTVSLPATAANQNVTITFVLPLDIELTSGGTSAAFTVPTAGTTSLVSTFRFTRGVDQVGASTDFPLTVTVSPPSHERDWNATFDASACASPSFLSSIPDPPWPPHYYDPVFTSKVVNFPFDTARRTKLTFTLAPYATLAGSAAFDNGDPVLSVVDVDGQGRSTVVLEMTLPLPGEWMQVLTIFAFTATSQSGRVSYWSIRFQVDRYPVGWFNDGWEASASGKIVGGYSDLYTIAGERAYNLTYAFVWEESEASSQRSVRLSIAPGAMIVPPEILGRDLPVHLGPPGSESPPLVFRVRSASSSWADWVIHLRVHKEESSTGWYSSSSSSFSSSSTGGGGEGTGTGPVDPPVQYNFDSGARAARGTGSSPLLLLPAVLFALLFVVDVFGQQLAQP